MFSTFAIVVITRKNLILEIVENKLNEIFTAQRCQLNTHLISSIGCLFLPSFIFIIQKLQFKKVRLIRNQTYWIFLFFYIWFAIHQSFK